MRVLTSSVLTFEWIMLALAIPVAINVAQVPPSRAWLAFAAVTVLTFLALSQMRRPAGVWFGWSVQVVAIVCGLIVPMLALMGVLFAGLYFWAIKLGTQVEDAKAQHEIKEKEIAQ